jgi:hypothetical protein
MYQSARTPFSSFRLRGHVGIFWKMLGEGGNEGVVFRESLRREVLAHGHLVLTLSSGGAGDPSRRGKQGTPGLPDTPMLRVRQPRGATQCRDLERTSEFGACACPRPRASGGSVEPAPTAHLLPRPPGGGERAADPARSQTSLQPPGIRVGVQGPVYPAIVSLAGQPATIHVVIPGGGGFPGITGKVLPRLQCPLPALRIEAVFLWINPSAVGLLAEVRQRPDGRWRGWSAWEPRRNQVLSGANSYQAI